MTTIALNTESGTAGQSLVEDTQTDEQTRTVEMLHQQAAQLRTRTHTLHQETREVHDQARNYRLDQLTQQLAREPLPQILDRLHDRGFSWRDLAQAAGVSVPAVRKWRRGEPATPINHRRAAKLLAVCEMIDDGGRPALDTASWFEMPLHDHSPMSPFDLYLADRLDLVLDWAEMRLSAEQILNVYDPDWRDHQSPFAVVVGEDDVPSIIRREP